MSQYVMKLTMFGVLMVTGLVAVSAATFLLLTKDHWARAAVTSDDETRERREAVIRVKLTGWGAGALAAGIVAICTALYTVLR